MAWGGKRPGAGRKRGTLDKATAARQQAIEASGITPLDYMLTVLRDEDAPAEDRLEAVKAAAPYVHAKLANVEHKGDDGRPLQIIIKRYASEN